ncbi:hypothetical protein [Streptomyces sp. NPDC049040]|uniref:hypothetical protein n=1 Tax=Streptomyces sp. NPDC049040 TaxID=3365593 RepID=UPI003720019F
MKQLEAHEMPWTESCFTGRPGVVDFALTTQVLRTRAWTPVTLRKRQEALPDELYTAWRL